MALHGQGFKKIQPGLKMTRALKYFMINVFCFALVICLCSNVTAGPKADQTGLQIRDGKISAKLVDATLRDIIRQIKVQDDIWFRVEEDLAGHKVSVRFAEVPLDEGLRRILKGMNHSLVYSTDSKVAGVFILGNGDMNPGYSTPTKVFDKMHARSPVDATSGPVENPTPPKISTLRPVNPSYLPRAVSDIRANPLGMSRDLRMSRAGQ